MVAGRGLRADFLWRWNRVCWGGRSDGRLIFRGLCLGLCLYLRGFPPGLVVCAFVLGSRLRLLSVVCGMMVMGLRLLRGRYVGMR